MNSHKTEISFSPLFEVRRYYVAVAWSKSFLIIFFISISNGVTHFSSQWVEISPEKNKIAQLLSSSPAPGINQLVLSESLIAFLLLLPILKTNLNPKEQGSCELINIFNLPLPSRLTVYKVHFKNLGNVPHIRVSIIHPPIQQFTVLQFSVSLCICPAYLWAFWEQGWS